MYKETQSAKQLELFPSRKRSAVHKIEHSGMVKTILDNARILELRNALLGLGLSYEDIEKSIVDYYNASYNNTISQNPVFDIYKKYDGILNIYSVVALFESLFDDVTKSEYGIVFTPHYIADYIIQKVTESITEWNKSIKIIDPSCGCGVFIVSAIEYIHKKYNVSLHDIVRDNIFGIDCITDNVRRTKLLVKLLSIVYNENFISPNVLCADALSTSWPKLFNINSFDLIIGNPPYVNPHDLPKNVSDYLRKNFTTTNNGTFNIYYAFIELSIKYINQTGLIGYIIPNNMLRIKAASELRTYLSAKQAVRTIIDFKDNMIFSPIRSYNCIMLLSKGGQTYVEYSIIEKTIDIPNKLCNAHFLTIDRTHLDDKYGWNLLDKKDLLNIEKIESQLYKLKAHIHTGIATLRDSVYMVDKNQDGYYKLIDGHRYYVDRDLVVDLYKIPDLKGAGRLEDVKRYIICPYIMVDGKRILLSESDLKANFRKTYEVLAAYKDELAKRDAGSNKGYPWFAYGRSQGLNGFNEKLLFPTFSYKPRFVRIKDKMALFCNGYAIFQSDYPFDILERVVNSKVMDYYIRYTSYQIEGGYYCYQKKYIEKFSLPIFSCEEIEYIRHVDDDALSTFLMRKYGVDID